MGFSRAGVWGVLLASVLGAACGGRDDSSPEAAGGRAVTALGRVTPDRTVVAVAGPQGDRVAHLEVKEGDVVAAGAPLARLESHDVRQAELRAAEAAARDAGERLEAETRYAAAAVAQARERVRLLEAELTQARRDLERVESLRAGRLVSEVDFDAQSLLVSTRGAALDEAQAALATAEAGQERARAAVALRSAEAQVVAAEARLRQSLISAPRSGRVLRISTWPGEAVGARPILELGDTGTMYVVAEVHETDLDRVRVGQRATAASPALPAELGGAVEEIGWLIAKGDVLDLDPRADVDTRVVPVRIRLDDPRPVAHLTHLEVRVRIEPGPPGPARPAP